MKTLRIIIELINLLFASCYKENKHLSKLYTNSGNMEYLIYVKFSFICLAYALIRKYKNNSVFIVIIN